MIRKAAIKDIKPIHKLLGYYAGRGLLLPRSLSELYDHLRDFWVLAAEEDQDSELIGVCALGICWEDLAEIRSLAVVERCQGRNLGRMLLERCLDEAGTLGMTKIFTLTYVPEFFQKFGFREVDKAVLPHKVWADCLKCTKFPDCDEIAMIVEL
jgi:amino-acid N-acetyltransferase